MAQKVIGIYHKDCLDGATAGAVLLKKFPDITFSPLSRRYTEDDLSATLNLVDKDTIVYIVDFSLRKGHTERVIEKAKEVINIDHHIGAEKELRGLAEKNKTFTFVFDNDRSGASLTWVHFYGEKNIPPIILYVEDSDLWRFALGDKTRWAASYLYGFSDNPQELLSLIERGDSAMDEILTKGKMLWKYRESLVEELLEDIKPLHIKIGKFVVPIHNTPEFLRSDVGHALAEKLGKAVATFVVDGDTVRLHFRGTNSNVPSALELAQMVGGNGHKNAAGAKVSLKDFFSMIKVELK